MPEELIEIEEPKVKKTVVNEQTEFKVIVHPHTKQAQKVTELTDDTLEEIEKIKRFITRINKNGYHGLAAFAIAQPQVNSESPLRYFVDKNHNVFINPVITESSDPVKSKEKCLSYPFRSAKKIKRFHKVTFEYYNDKMNKKTLSVEGLKAAIVQHEIDHFNGVDIYNK